MSGDREPILPAVRAAVLFRAKGRCEDCGADTALELHHLTYRKFGGEIFGHEGAGRSARALPALPPRSLGPVSWSVRPCRGARDDCHQRGKPT